MLGVSAVPDVQSSVDACGGQMRAMLAIHCEGTAVGTRKECPGCGISDSFLSDWLNGHPSLFDTQHRLSPPVSPITKVDKELCLKAA